MIPPRLAAFFSLWLCGGFCSAAIIINCVGDSITAGVGVNNPTADSYPSKLQKLLGTNYAVGNYGLSGATLLKQGDTPYWGTPTYVLSHGRSISSAPNIVLILLGTNDSKPQNWIYGTNFYSNYLDLIASYATNHYLPNPRILICTTPPVFNNGYVGINPGIEATNISPLIRQLGTNQNIQVIDMQSLLAGHATWFPDNVHPNSQGTTVIAAVIYTALQGDTMNGSIPSLEINPIQGNKAILNWPAGGAGWVPQLTSTLGSTSNWTIVTNAIVNNGTTVRFTNSMAAQNTLLRLWNPSYPNN